VLAQRSQEPHHPLDHLDGRFGFALGHCRVFSRVCERFYVMKSGGTIANQGCLVHLLSYPAGIASNALFLLYYAAPPLFRASSTHVISSGISHGKASNTFA
jgi:hypothetical protein